MYIPPMKNGTRFYAWPYSTREHGLTCIASTISLSGPKVERRSIKRYTCEENQLYTFRVLLSSRGVGMMLYWCDVVLYLFASP